MINKEKIIEILKNHIEEGYDILAQLKINDRFYSEIIINMFEASKTLNQLQQELEFDKTMNSKDSEDITESEVEMDGQ